MRELDKTKVYSLEDLTHEELDNVLECLKKNDETWSDCELEEMIENRVVYSLRFNDGYWIWEGGIEPITNAKELFYTLEDVQVDCSELTEEQVKEMCNVYENNGYKQCNNKDSLKLIDNYTYLRVGMENEFYVNYESRNKTTITYDKFMQLFGRKDENFKKLVEVLNEELTEEVSELQYEVTMIAEKPKHPLTPVIEKAKEIAENTQNILKAYKETSNKLNYELDFNFITQLAERMAQNKHKYEPYNWQRLDNVEDLKQALFRHVIEVMKGNYEDDNRLFGHLESIALNCMFINYQLNGK